MKVYAYLPSSNDFFSISFIIFSLKIYSVKYELIIIEYFSQIYYLVINIVLIDNLQLIEWLLNKNSNRKQN
ncbi:hypothetical protein PFNF135_03401 [Plasmodium falciparum NF135/5.C10]|uniref:Uncharacterized protein n=1 Tax=Plasmodium falciparum NF135/5.C10 TaxID=1036726 RepID=W4IEQ2_PLAFA|nr:hypothetical protein PFNF135_03401 [Plasmodium falciparum NF135/5.C10]